MKNRIRMITTLYMFIIQLIVLVIIFSRGYARVDIICKVAMVTPPSVANKQQEGKWEMVKSCCAMLLHKQI